MGKKVHKELKKLTPEKKESKIGLYAQLLLTLATIVLALLYLIYKDLLIYLQLMLALDMFVIAYNNQKKYKRTFFTLLYIGTGVVILGIVVLNLLGV